MRSTIDREAQIRGMLPLVRAIARRVHRLVPSMDLDDLIGEGSIGLIRAVDAFDPNRGPTLEQYAKHLIVGTMLNGVRRMDPVPERVRRAIREGEYQRYRTAVERGSMPGAASFEGERPHLRRALLVAHRVQPLSLDRALPENESVPRNWADDPANVVAERSQVRELETGVRNLPPRERTVVTSYYFGEESLNRIGARMGISAQRASQLHQAAIARLRKHCHASSP